MNLYLIERPQKAVNFDEVAGMVVAANSPRGARKLASQERGDEKAICWLSPKYCKVSLLADRSKIRSPGVVLVDFQAGD
jgi:hypothetical protein